MGSVDVVIARSDERNHPIRVAIGGAGRVTTADSSNRAVFEHLFPGRYSLLAYTTPDSGGSFVAGSVVIRAGAREHVSLTLTSKAAANSAACPGTARPDDSGAVLLVFVDSSRTRLNTNAAMRLFFSRDELVSASRVRSAKSNSAVTSAPAGW
jgi:hypothetical protein